jgi:hypothetical protein
MKYLPRLQAALLSPFGRVSLLLVIPFIGLGSLSGWPWPFGPFVLFFLSVSVGPYMGVTYPFGWPYVLLLILALALAIFGIVRFRRVHGQLAFVAGVVLWTICGLMGLGTGT